MHDELSSLSVTLKSLADPEVEVAAPLSFKTKSVIQQG